MSENQITVISWKKSFLFFYVDVLEMEYQITPIVATSSAGSFAGIGGQASESN